MPSSAALAGRTIKDQNGNEVWCAPATAELLARAADYASTEHSLALPDDDELLDWFPQIGVLQEHVVRQLYRTPEDKFFVWARWVIVQTNDKRIEHDELTLLSSRDQAWRWCQEPDVTLLADLPRFPSKRRR